MRVAIVHYWLLNRRGGEAVLDALCRLAPEADIFTLFYDPERSSPIVRQHRVTASFLNPWRRHYRTLLPLMPIAIESFDLRGYDLIISSESGPAKGVLAPSSARHLCYCHTPMRYLWDLYPAYRNQWTHSRWKRAAMAPVANYLRLWDFASAARVDRFIANSHNVEARIRKIYRRDAEVIYPPVAVESFQHKPSEDYFLVVSELVAYKQLDYAVATFSRNGRRLRIVGDGPEYRRLKTLAHGNVEFVGRLNDADLREAYARSRAFLLPGEEDFGIAPVEALASGKPVVALARGGALETVPPCGGVFYPEPEPEHLERALAELERLEPLIRPAELIEHAQQFSEAEFRRRMAAVLAEESRKAKRSSVVSWSNAG